MTIEQPGMRERKKLHTRQLIEAAAVDLVLEHGIDSVTIEAIAERADITPRTFFNHFSDKIDALLGVPRDRQSMLLIEPSEVAAASALDFAVALLHANIATISRASLDLDRRRREIFASYPELMAREMEKITIVEGHLTSAIEGYLAEKGEAAGTDREDYALAVTVTVGAAARLAFIRWSREPASPEDLGVFFDAAVATITSISSERKPT
jgi:AcrR family transcriptional regulator